MHAVSSTVARYLIDTDVMVDVSRRVAAAATYVDSLDDVTLSIITAHELIVGARNQRDADGIDGLIKTYPVHADLGARITGSAYELLKRYAKSDGLRTFDALIAATAIEEGLTLVSKNRKHFQMIGELDLEIPNY
jgi:predicted nucleic acid-binding protein